nr:MAG: hypothetical protein AM324_00915 [Candidatus Thorarchaeota archaeon SMTZ1-83]
MRKDIETILDWCLDEMKKGRSVDYCLNLYPELTPQLEPLLRLAGNIQETPTPEPRREAINMTLMKIGEVAAARRRERAVRERFSGLPFVWRPAFAKALAFSLITAVAVLTVGVLSARSLPGDLLYPLKLATERVRFTLTRTAEGKAELRLTFAGARLEELIRAVEQQGTLDESSLKTVLEEAELALDEAMPIEEDRFVMFVTKLSHFTSYKEAVLRRLRPRVPVQRRGILDRAIEICGIRCRCMTQMILPNGSGVKCREWKPGCRCQDM